MSLSSLAQRVLHPQSKNPVYEDKSGLSSVTTFDDYFEQAPAHETFQLANELRQVQMDAQSVRPSLRHRLESASDAGSLFSNAMMSMRRFRSPTSVSDKPCSENFGVAYDHTASESTCEGQTTSNRSGTSDARHSPSLMLRVLSLGLLKKANERDEDVSEKPSLQAYSRSETSDAPLPRRAGRTLKRWCALCRDRLSP